MNPIRFIVFATIVLLGLAAIEASNPAKPILIDPSPAILKGAR